MRAGPRDEMGRGHLRLVKQVEAVRTRLPTLDSQPRMP